MATVASLNVLLTADSSALQGEFNKASRAAEAYNRKLETLNSQAKSGQIDQATFAKRLGDATTQFQKSSGAAAIIDANRTALERYNDRLGKAASLFKSGALNQNQFSREVAAARVSYDLAGNSLQASIIIRLNTALPAAAVVGAAAIAKFLKTSFDAVDTSREWSIQLGT